MTRRLRATVAATGLLLALLLAAGMLRGGGAEAQQRTCAADGYAARAGAGARFTITPNPSRAGRTVTFDGTASSSSRGGPPIRQWYWDLDGDGAYETVRDVPTVSRPYIAPGTAFIRLVVVDACGAASAPATLPLTVAADETPPVLRVTSPRRLRRSTALRRGVKVVAGCGEPCRLTATATADRRTRRALRLRSSRLARATGSLATAGRRTLTLRLALSRSARRRAARLRSGRLVLRVEARDAAGNPVAVRRTVTLR